MNTHLDVSKKPANLEPKTFGIGIRGRLIMGFAIVMFIFLIAIGITLAVIVSTKNYTNHVISIELPTYDTLLDLNTKISRMQSQTQMWIITGDAKYKAENANMWNSINANEITIDKLSESWPNASYKQKWNEIKSLLARYKTSQNSIQNLPVEDKVKLTQQMTTELMPILNQFYEDMNSVGAANGLLDIQSKELNQGTRQIVDNLNYLQILEYLIAFIGITTSIIVGMLTAKGILNHINLFRRHSNRIASGDLTQHIRISTNDEIGQLGQDLNKMTESLATIAKETTQSCHTIVSMLEEVRHAVDSQSSGATEQASSINEITASITEIEKSSSQTMEKAKALGEAAERTQEKGQLGLNAVEQSVQGMKEVKDKVQLIAQTILDLSNQTQQVGEITAVVNNLAQQSKMLALNASIEAAKAGEAGKGFAIVAVEVKNLAEQSEQSTAQVQKILEDIRHATEKAVMVTEEGTKGVDYGTNLVEQTGEIIRNLNEVIHETALATQQIEAAVRQESAGIEQITAGMTEINQVTASFVDGVKQTNEAMNNLATVAKNLKSQVETYKV